MLFYHLVALPILLVVITGFSSSVVAVSAPLDLATAERLALAQDLTVPSLTAAAAALENAAVAAGQLPDPKLKLGAMNFPTDSFSRDQEPMTQLQVGVQQAFPPGNTLREKQARMEAMAGAGAAQVASQTRSVLRDTRLAYLELHYQLQAKQVIDGSRRLFDQLLEVTESQYATGRKNQQDVLRAGVELALLDDRATNIQTGLEKARANLARLIGSTAASGELAPDFPLLRPLPTIAELSEGLVRHPVMQMKNRQVEAGQSNVNIARERYKPGWMLDLTYGDRTGNNANGSARSDFISAMVVVDIPVFTGKRQDKMLAAEQENLSATQLTRDDQLRELQRMLNSEYAEWRRLGERVERYASSVLPQAELNAESSLLAYQSGVSDFTGLMRARLMVLESSLMALRLRADHAMAQARLLYLAGETS